MRIIAGEWSSRRLKTLGGTDTRPTLDKVRGAVFSSLGGFFEGGTVLDLYGGSGAVALEALSRGFDYAVICDKSRDAVRIIRENVSALQAEDRCRILAMEDRKALMLLAAEQAVFDLVYLDPPYAKQRNEEVIRFLDEHQMIKENGRIAVECLREDPVIESIGRLKKYKEAVYGITRIVYYRTEEEI